MCHLTTSFTSSVTLAVAILALGACSFISSDAPQLPNIASDMPTAWAEQTHSDAEAAVAAPDWWRSFRSKELLALITAALNANPNLVIATEHVHQAEAQVRYTNASLFPQLSFGTSTVHSRTLTKGSPWTTIDGTNSYFTATDEIDLWGLNAAEVRGAESLLRASHFDFKTVQLTLLTGVANAYFQILSLRDRLAIARENLIIANRVFVVVNSRVRNGAASAIDLALQQKVVLAQRAAVPSLELQERQTLFALALLLGRPPEGFNVGFAPTGATVAVKLTDLAVPRIAPELPADLLTRRPDIARAEAQLAAAHANVAMARAALLPRIQLTGSQGFASNLLFDFINPTSVTWTLGTLLVYPIFDGGRLHSQVDVMTSLERELIANYRKSILAALTDVESAMAFSNRTADQEFLLEQVQEQAQRALQLAEIRYREGIADLLTVLEVQQTLFQTKDQIAQVRLLRLQATIGLFKALGGSFLTASFASFRSMHNA